MLVRALDPSVNVDAVWRVLMAVGDDHLFQSARYSDLVDALSLPRSTVMTSFYTLDDNDELSPGYTVDQFTRVGPP
jgi:hypothetical protein